jgi:DNA-binding NtrC family response regulator
MDDAFNPDFLDRFFPFHVPPLHKRREDILHYINWSFPGLLQELLLEEIFELLAHPWPGGVREIERVGETILIALVQYTIEIAKAAKEHPDFKEYWQHGPDVSADMNKTTLVIGYEAMKEKRRLDCLPEEIRLNFKKYPDEILDEVRAISPDLRPFENLDEDTIPEMVELIFDTFCRLAERYSGPESPENALRVSEQPSAIWPDLSNYSWKDLQNDVRKKYLQDLLRATGGLQKEMAQRAGVADSTVTEWMKEFGMSKKKFEKSKSRCSKEPSSKQ